MNNKDEIKTKKKIAAVDILIVMLVLLCIAGIVIRIAVGESSLFSKDNRGEYTVSYVITGEQDENSAFFAEGKQFFLESGEAFGTLTGSPAFTPAVISSENSRGEYVQSYSSDGTVDIRGTATVIGTMTDTGFLLNSNTYIAPNMSITVSSSDITVKLLITDITKAQ